MWNYDRSDRYTKDQLLKFKAFFEEDLRQAIAELNKVKKLEKYGLPGYRWTVLKCEEGVTEALHNLSQVNTAIDNHE